MKKTVLLFAIIIFSNSFGQSSLWNKTSEEAKRSFPKMDRGSIPSKFELYSLNLPLLKTKLEQAPLDLQNIPSSVVISFPNPSGELEEYTIYEAPVMEQGLSDKFPGLKSYSGKSITNPAQSIRFSITLFGLHVMSFGSETGTFYIDTYTKDLNNYIVYNREDALPDRSFDCLVTDQTNDIKNKVGQVNSDRVSDGFFRTYRLAMACTIEYAAFHVNAAGLAGGTLTQKKAAVLSAMVVTMTRVNGVFENDMSLRMNLIANNDLIIFIDSDSFSNTNASVLIDESQTVIDATIGAANYDIGHTVGTGGGGLAQLNSPCTGNKARGITGLSSPVGDAFNIDYVSHEMGHQWGGNHTFNNSCGGNRNTSTAVEPGSGTTIMSYSGICAPDIQSDSDAYFHTISITEMTTFIISGAGGNCATPTVSGNIAPTANAGSDFTIPKGTPFILKGAGTDSNGDTLTYCWEQIDIEATTQPPLQTATGGPNFRSRSATISPNRYMPPLASVVAGVLNPTWEVVPTVARTNMDFALTVRDNRSSNGALTKRDDMVLTIANVGPFLVTSPNTAVSYFGNSTQTITWDVAGTTANGINCANVDIYLSTNGGLTFPTLLQLRTPNDGTQAINIPNLPGTANRIMIAGNNHIFYDISNTNFTIVADTASPSAPTLSASGTTINSTNLSWTGATDNVAVTGYDVYRNAVLIGSTTTATVFNVTGLIPNTAYVFTVRAKDAAGNVSVSSNSVNVSTTDTTSPSAPTLLASGTTINSTNLSWTVATDNVAVTGYDVYQGAVLIGSTTTATVFNVTGLIPNTAYVFTVRSKDAAGNLSISSNSVNVSTTDTTAPFAPTLSASGTTINSTNLSWSGATDNVSVTGYDVYQNAVLVGSTTTATVFNVTGLIPNTAYVFTVRAKDAAGNISLSSNSVNVSTTDTTAPSAPTLSASGTTINSTDLSWSGATDNVAVAGYDVYQNALLIGSTTTATVFNVTGLIPNTVYVFTVRARDAAGNVSINSNSVNVNTIDTTSPSAPTLTASGTTINSTNLSWSGATDNVAVTGYDVYQNTLLIGSTTTATVFNVTGLIPNTVYVFTVRARDAAGNVSINSNSVNVNTIDTTSPSAPTLTASGTTINSTNLSWTLATDNVAVTGYDVYQNAVLIGSTSIATVFNVTGLILNTAYVFTVRARDAAGNISLSSNSVNVSTTDTTAPTVPTLSASGTTINSTDLSWTGATDDVAVTGYDVYQNAVLIGSTTTATVFNVTGLIPNTAYLFSVRAKDAAGNVSLSSNFVNITTSADAIEVSIKLFIEGYYDTVMHTMLPVKANQGIGVSTTIVDDLTIELRNDGSPFALAATTTAELQTNGIVRAFFNSSISGLYYIVVKHRNALQTWSALPIPVSASTPTYDFTDTNTKAFGSNMIQVESGVWALYSGDINQDDVVDASDNVDLANDINNSNFGYLNTDLNGDGAVDNSDLPILSNNVENSIFSVYP